VFIKADAWARIRTLPQLEPRIAKPRGWAAAVLNHQAGPLTSRPLRQAIQAALDMEPIMAAGFGDRAFYRLDGAVFFPEQRWHSTASTHLYNQRDAARAARLARAAGYAGQPIRWMTTQEYDFLYRTALVASQQLAAAGIVVDLQVFDWATVNSRVMKPDVWDVVSSALVFTVDPANHIAFRCAWWGGWCLEEKERLLAELQRETDDARRQVLVDRLQTLLYEDVGRIKLGDYFTLDAARRQLRGEFRTAARLYFWNSWLAP
jgi:peptide/nickel transport system substrate-binding protein